MVELLKAVGCYLMPSQSVMVFLKYYIAGVMCQPQAAICHLLHERALANESVQRNAFILVVATSQLMGE